MQYFFSNSTSLSADVIPAIPFIVTAIVLVYFMIRGTAVDESEGVGGPLDRAIMPQGDAPTGSHRDRYASAFGWQLPLLAFGILCILPLVVSRFWIGLIGQGVCFAHHPPVDHPGDRRGRHDLALPGHVRRHRGGGRGATRRRTTGGRSWLSVVVGGLVALPFGVIIGLVTIRLGNLYVALVTLTVGLLFDDLVFTQQIFSNYSIGVNVNLPSFASSPRAFTYLALGVFALASLVILNLQRSTTGWP